MTGGGAFLVEAKPAASPVNPSNGANERAMAELVEAAAPRRVAEAGFGVSPNRKVIGINGTEQRRPSGVGLEILP